MEEENRLAVTLVRNGSATLGFGGVQDRKSLSAVLSRSVSKTTAEGDVAYNCLHHIVRSILLSEYRDNVPIAMFTAYFDASGTKRKTVLTVAGFVSRINKWTRFDEEWKEILDAYGVSRFHMTDFASSGGEFQGWKGKSFQRREFIEKLVSCIKRNTNKGFAASVIVEDFNRVNEEYPLAENAGLPFALCARTCTGMLKKWAMRKNLDFGRIMVFFEDGDEDRGDFQARAKIDGFRIRSLSKDDSRVFQAADLAAWKVRTAIHGAFEAGNREDAEEILRSLDPIQGILTKSGVFDAAALRRLCVKACAPKRSDMSPLT
jgi:hypothetical protein